MKGTPLHTLETTIQNVVCSPPQEKYFSCKRCKGCFPSSCVEKVGPICKTCVESKESEDRSIDAVVKRVRPPRPVSAPKPSSNSELCNLSQINKHWKKRTRTSNWVSRSKSSESASVPILLRKKCLWRMKKKSTKLSVKLKTPLITSNSVFIFTEKESMEDH